MLAIIWNGRECIATQVTYSYKHKGVPATVTTLKSSRLWQCVARQVSPGIVKDLHPVVKKQTSANTHTMHMVTPQKTGSFSNTTVTTLNLPFLLHNLPLSQLSSHIPWRWRHLQNICSQTTVCQSKTHHCGITHPAHSPLCSCRCVTRRQFNLNDLLHTSQP